MYKWQSKYASLATPSTIFTDVIYNNGLAENQASIFFFTLLPFYFFFTLNKCEV